MYDDNYSIHKFSFKFSYLNCVNIYKSTHPEMSDLENWKKNLWILMICVLLCSASFTMVIPFLPLFLFELGVGDDTVNLWAGAVFSSAFLVGAFMAPIWGSLADRYGKKKMVLRAGVCIAVVYALIALVRNPWELLIVRMLHGLVGGFVPAAMAIVASTSPDKKLGLNLGWMQAALATGTIMGPLFGGILSEVFGMRLSFVVASLLILASAAAVWIWVHEEGTAVIQEKSRIRDDIRTAFRNPIFFKMLLFLFIFQLSFNTLQPLLTLYIAELQGELKGAVLTSGIIFSLIGVATIIAAPRWGKIGSTQGYPKVLIICLISAGCISMIQYFSGNIWQFGALHFIFGLFFAGVVPAIHTIAVQSTDTNFRGRSFGLTTSANQLGAMTGPLIGGGISLWFGIPVVFVMTGVILLITGLYIWSDSRTWNLQTNEERKTPLSARGVQKEHKL
jgi:DHA1 family multidrug resistance protein-like MFS transporter